MVVVRTVYVKDIAGDVCVSMEDGDLIYRAIHDGLVNDMRVTVDFSGVTICVACFLNAALGRLYSKFSSDILNKMVRIECCDGHILSIIKRVLKNSLEYYALTPEKRKAYDEAILKVIEDS